MMKPEFAGVLKWLRSNLLMMIFAAMLLLQFLTWRELAKLRHDYDSTAQTCGDNYACTVALAQTDRALLYEIAHK
jgi:hypothetical protein